MIGILEIVDAVTSHASASGLFATVEGHEPKSAPPNGVLTFAVWAQSVRPAMSSGISKSSAVLTLNLRIYTSFIKVGDPDSIDPRLIDAVDIMMTAYASDFTLGDRVRCIDLRGIEGIPLSVEAGYLTQDGKMYRVMTITLPLIVNDAWNEVP